MLRFRAFALLISFLPVCAAAAACAPADASLVGVWRLHGVMEMASEIALKKDGSFEYALAYGALDEAAEGCWSRKGSVVTLVAAKFEVSMEDPAKFSQLDLEVTSDRELARRFDANHVGRYARR
jgi:hypothetical protein